MAITITSFSPATGPTSGGTRVVFVGTGLDTVTSVDFGSFGGAIDTTATNTPTSLTVLSPPIPNGTTPLTMKISLIDDVGGVIAQTATNYTFTVVSVGVYSPSAAWKWRMSVDASTNLDGSQYIQMFGITDFQPAIAQTSVDDSDFESGIWGSDFVTQLKWSLVMKVDRKTLPGYTEDPAQRILRVASFGFAQSSVVRVRWWDRNGGPEAFDGLGTVSWSEDGGGTAAKSSCSVTIMGRGIRNPIANPAG